MSRLNFAALVLISCLASGCTLLNPFVDRRREAGAKTEARLYVGRSKPATPAICYNSLWTPYSEVKKLADEECRKQGTGTYAVPDKQTVFTCRVFIPNHYYFKCKK